jgi:hypothetical protein
LDVYLAPDIAESFRGIPTSPEFEREQQELRALFAGEAAGLRVLGAEHGEHMRNGDLSEQGRAKKSAEFRKRLESVSAPYTARVEARLEELNRAIERAEWAAAGGLLPDSAGGHVEWRRPAAATDARMAECRADLFAMSEAERYDLVMAALQSGRHYAEVLTAMRTALEHKPLLGPAYAARVRQWQLDNSPFTARLEQLRALRDEYVRWRDCAARDRVALATSWR